MEHYYEATVVVSFDNGKKTIKKKENYLVKAMSVTDAEAKVTEWMPNTIDFEVQGAKLSKFIDVIG